MESSAKKTAVLIAAAVAIIVILTGSGFFLGFTAGRKIPEAIIVSGVQGLTNATTTPANFGTFWEAWQDINDNYLKAADVSDGTKVQGAISGLVQSLGDPYSVYFTPDAAKSFMEDVEGTFSGIGAEIGVQQGHLVIIAPLKDTPADKAGLKPNDQILFIDATSTDSLSVDQAIAYIRGDTGTTVKLTIDRQGWDKPKVFPIVRQPITSPTLDFKMLPGHIAYVQLYSFNASAESLFWNAMLKAANAGTDGLILDLRGDPGGYLDVAVNLAGWFLPRGTVVVKEAGRQGISDTLRADGNAALAKVPVVVLIDNGSASASEILAGALRDDRGAKLVGEQSFGKGTVQEFVDLSDGSVIKLTIAHWVLPSGKILENGGLVPDYPVPISDAQAAAGEDPQLAKAIQVLQSEMK